MNYRLNRENQKPAAYRALLSIRSDADLLARKRKLKDRQGKQPSAYRAHLSVMRDAVLLAQRENY